MLKKYWRVYKTFIANSFSYEAQYRKDTIMKVATNLLYIAMLFSIIEIIFNVTPTIADWNKGEVYLLSVIWVLMDELFICLFRENFYKLSFKMTRGDLDKHLTKPINPLFYVTTNQLLIRAFYRFIVQLVILVWVIAHFNFTVTIWGALLLFPLLLVGILISFSLSLLANTLSFWLVKIENVNDALATMHTMGRYPFTIWPRTLKIIFLTALPIAFTSYIPLATLTGRLAWYGIMYTFIFAATLFFIAVKFWNFALKRYSSASS